MMRLLKLERDGAFSLVEYSTDEIPPYAILSHTWGRDDEEISFEDIQNDSWKVKGGIDKFRFCRRQAAKDSLDYCWIDTCCIDKKNANELAESINSMFLWYHKAERCYVYLSDVSTKDDPTEEHHSQNQWKPAFKQSRWFKRGWTLQELIAPQSIEFFSKEGARLGNRVSLEETIHEITKIPVSALRGERLTGFTVDERLAWTHGRETKRKEDMAYSLLGIFDTFMPLIYGEGLDNAMKRLRKELAESLRVDQRSQDILDWLGAPDPSTNYDKALRARQSRTGLWFLESHTFTKWRVQPSAVWLYGIPGCGKTILSSTILENVLQYAYNDRSKQVAYFFFDFNERQKQDPQRMVCSLISQLAQRSVKPLAELDALYTSCKGGRQEPSLSSLLQVLHQLVKGISDTFVILDALDESTDRGQLQEILEHFTSWHANGLHLLLTSRREKVIEDILLPIIDSTRVKSIQSDVVDRDVETFVRQQLLEDKQLAKWRDDEAIQRKIEDTLTKGSHGMFRWVACQLESLRKCRNERKLYEVLRTLPSTLDATYDQILCAIREEDVDYALRILRWLSFSSRAMTLSEVAEIVAIDVNRDPAFDRREVLRDPSDVLEICSSLIAIAEPNTWDSNRWLDRHIPSGPVVLLAHYSVKEYLFSKRIYTSKSALYAMESGLCHQFIARCCIQYLQQPGIGLNGFALAIYAAREWIPHAQSTEHQGTELSVDIYQLLGRSGDTFLGWLRLYNPDKPWEERKSSLKLSSCASPLYYAAMAGFTVVAGDLLKNGANVNAQGGEYGNALQAASSKGHEQVVQLLLDRGADVYARGGYYGNALYAASFKGHEQIVKLLLDRGADVNSQGGYDGNALQAASFKGHKQSVQLLLNRGADVNAQGEDYGNALQAASDGGHEQIVKLLLDANADVNAQGGLYGNALQAASDRGHEQIVKLLLDRGADVNSQGGYYGNALQAASFGGHEQTVQLLLDRGANVNAQGGYYDNALYAASFEGHEQTVQLLLNRGADVNAQGEDYGNALQAALTKGHEQIVQQLLKAGAYIPNW